MAPLKKARKKAKKLVSKAKSSSPARRSEKAGSSRPRHWP